jgi:dTMP kinase
MSILIPFFPLLLALIAGAFLFSERFDVMANGGKQSQKGRFITFEGIDGSGKSTQAKRVADALMVEGFDVELTLNPGGTELGKAIREILLHHDKGPVDDTAELLLYMADRAQHMNEVVKPAITAGKIVICDRFLDSTLAYQGYGRQLGTDLITQLHEVALGGIQPDKTIWLEGDVERLLERAKCRSKADRLEQEALEFYSRVNDGFAALAKAHPRRILAFDAFEPIEQLTIQITQSIKQQLLL